MSYLRHSAIQVSCIVLRHGTAAVGLLGYEKANALDLVGPAEAFASAFRDDGKGKLERCYEVSIIGLTRRSFTTESGIVFQPTGHDRERAEAGHLDYPGWMRPSSAGHQSQGRRLDY